MFPSSRHFYHYSLAWVAKLLMTAPPLPGVTLWSRRPLWFVAKSSMSAWRHWRLVSRSVRSSRLCFLFNQWPSHFFISPCFSRNESYRLRTADTNFSNSFVIGLLFTPRHCDKKITYHAVLKPTSQPGSKRVGHIPWYIAYIITPEA